MKKSSKRLNGEGSIYRHPSGLWAASVTIGKNYTTGKSIRKTVYGKTKQIVLAKKEELLAESKGGVSRHHDQKMTVGTWISRWLDVYAKPSVRPNTFAGYRAMVKNHILPALGAIGLKQLRGIDIQQMVNQITEAGGSPRTAEAAYAVLRIALNKAFCDEIITKLPFKSVAIPQKIKKEFVPLSTAQWQQLFTTAKEQPELYAAVSLAWATGISRSELLALQWSDLHMVNHTISIARAAIITDQGAQLHNTKSAARRRILPLPASTIEDLTRYKAQQAAVHLLATAWDNQNLIFPTASGALQDPRVWSKKFARLAKAAGVAVSFHKLRHDHASRLADSGVSIKDAQYRLGHSTSQMLLDVYTHKMTGGQEHIAKMLQTAYSEIIF